eukprot:TRINITY_DN38351_c0_g1_i1.p1 TRINITY_DN38351_c0_g1~~TRINITY_DN38351_c0_g1_i1.p1  ORF type:complete len:284 (-),score=49.62 TRINITY_DN38351_c0_g1_i1:1102-1953(-)
MVAPVVLVTGCSQGGIGHELCKSFATAGCTVFATARRMESMSALKERGMETLILDVTSQDSITEGVATVIEKAGRIDILVSNAGVLCAGPVAEMPLSDVRKTFEANTFGALALTQAVVPHMAKQGSGKVVVVGSVLGYVTTPWNGIYAASKAALHAFTDTMRMELHPFGIRVTLVMPGAIKSNIAESFVPRPLQLYHAYEDQVAARARLSQGSYATPTAELASDVVKEVLRPAPRAHFYCGAKSGLFYFLRWLPSWLLDFLMMRQFGLLKRVAQGGGVGSKID